jgi:streptogramin lyase
LDSLGNLWITDTKNGSVIEWNALGASWSPSSGFPAGGGPVAIDATGNVWISGDGVLAELTNLGSPLPGNPFGGVAGGGADISIDAQGNLWIPSSGAVNEFSNLGQELSPVNGFTNDGITGVTSVTVDSFNNIWLGNGTKGNFAELTNPGGQLIVNSQGASATGIVSPEMAADSAGDLWAVVSNSGAHGYVCEVTPYAGKGSTLIPTCNQSTALGGGSGLAFYDPAGIALDGAGTVWVASQGGGAAPVIAPSVLPIMPSLLGSSPTPTYLESQSLSAGPLRVAVDGSGNVWVLLSNNTVTEYVGIATPAVTPTALAVSGKKLGAKP